MATVPRIKRIESVPLFGAKVGFADSVGSVVGCCVGEGKAVRFGVIVGEIVGVGVGSCVGVGGELGEGEGVIIAVGLGEEVRLGG